MQPGGSGIAPGAGKMPQSDRGPAQGTPGPSAAPPPEAVSWHQRGTGQPQPLPRPPVNRSAASPTRKIVQNRARLAVLNRPVPAADAAIASDRGRTMPRYAP